MITRNKLIDAIRFIATVLVVLGHCAFYSISTSIPNMGCNWTQQIIDNTLFHKISLLATGLIYTCHMQLFIFLSGMVFRICLNSGKYGSFKTLVKTKYKRLVLPYVLVTILYNIPILIYSNYFDGNIINIVLYFIGFGKNHLWYLITLFIIFIITYIPIKATNKKNDKVFIILLIISLLFYILSEFDNRPIFELFYLDRVAKYWLWFLVGMGFIDVEKRINHWFSRAIGLKVFFILIVWISLYIITSKISRLFLIFLQASGILFWYGMSYWTLSKFPNLEDNILVKSIINYSMDIYLYGVPVNYLLISTMLKISQFIYLTNFGSLLLYSIRFITQILIGLFIPQIIKTLKYKIMRIVSWI